MDTSKQDELLLRQFNITHVVQIKLKKIKVNTGRTRFQRSIQERGKIGLTLNECNVKCFSKTLHNHQRLHKGKRRAPNVCPFCQKQFSVTTNIYRHMKICTRNPKVSDETWVAQQKRFKCEVCAFATVDKYSLKNHLRTHTDERPFQCTVCTKSFKSRKEVRKHYIRSHSGKKKNVMCPLCPKCFHTKAEVNQHIPTHIEERPFKCQFCEKRFKRSGNLNYHVKVCKENPQQMDKDWVEKMKKHKCHLCSFSSVTKSGLTIHFQTHTRETRFNCAFCTYKCFNQSWLDDHVRVETGEKPFKCSQCTYRAASRSAISRHFRRLYRTEPRQKDAG